MLRDKSFHLQLPTQLLSKLRPLGRQMGSRCQIIKEGNEMWQHEPHITTMMTTKQQQIPVV